MTRLNFTLDQTLFKKFKKYCVDIGETMAVRLRKIIQEELERVKYDK